jgi:ppGpp synthetase/RelA/SpoT-type nucleotidyltranferase
MTTGPGRKRSFAAGRQSAFLAAYQSYSSEYIESANLQLKGILEDWKTMEYWEKYADKERLVGPSPISFFTTRPKRPESVLDKIADKPRSYPEGLAIGSLRRMHDLLGARIVVYLESDLSLVDRAIRMDRRLELCPDDHPIAYLAPGVVERLGLEFSPTQVQEKPSGYASLHYITRLTEPINGPTPWFEIQVRTLAQHAWAEVQHALGYKPDVHVPSHVERQLAILARVAATFDDQFELLRDHLDSIAMRGEDINDAARISGQTLPGLIREADLRISRDWVGQVAKLLTARGVRTAGTFRFLMKAQISTAHGAQPARDLVRTEYQRMLGRSPRDSEVIGALANLADLIAAGELDVDTAKERIGAAIDYDRAWKHRWPEGRRAGARGPEREGAKSSGPRT